MNIRNAGQFICLAVILLSAPFPAAAEELTNALRAYLQQRLADQKANGGIVVGLVDEHGSQVVGCGKLDNGTDQEATGDTLFCLHSLTGVFTRLLLQDMVARREVKLDDPVSKYLPSSVRMPTRNGKEITLLELAAETSGLPTRPVGDLGAPRADNPLANYTVEKLYAFVSGCQLTSDPGTAHAHGAVGTSLLGHALARKAGTNLEALLVERICGPLKMDSTRFTLTPELKARVALEHNQFGYARPAFDWGALQPAGGLNSTADDLLKFVSAFALTPFKLTPLMEKCLSNGNPSAAEAERNLTAPQSGRFVGASGGGPGGVAYLCFDKTRRRGVVVLSAADDTDGNLGSFLLEYCEWGSSRRPIKTGTQAYDVFVGQYHAVAGQSQADIGIRRGGERLFAQSTGADSWLIGVLLPPGGGELLPEAENRFFERLSGTRLRFSRSFWGRVTGFTAHCQGTEFVYKRISDQPPKAPEPLRRPVAIKLAPGLLEACVGRYEFPPDAGMPAGLKVTIAREGDQLVWREGAIPVNLYAESETNFFDKIGGVQLTFLKNAQGEVTAVIAGDDLRREHKGMKLMGSVR